MSDPAPFPKQAASLRLRGRIRPVTRINRKVLAAGGVLAALGLFAAFTAALAPPRAASGPGAPEAFNTGAGRTPDGLARLPAAYDSPDIPRLGAPLAGDLGGTLVAEERAWGLEPDWNVPPTEDFRPSPFDEAVRARRLAEAKLADEAARAGLFFTTAPRTSPADVPGEAEPATGLGAELLALAGRASGAPGSDANLQDRKLAFTQSRPPENVLNPHTLIDPQSPYQVMAGSVIAAALLTGVQSDLPGTVTAQITQPVHDTFTGKHLLVPQGARLIGRYQSEISFGQGRVLVVWERIVFPDGVSLQISEPAADPSGAAGLAGRTDNHWGRVFAAAGLATLLGIGAELGEDGDSETLRAVRRGFSGSIAQSGERIVDRSLSIQPTIRIAPGAPVRVLVTRDLVFR
jgi:type IV secretion system protein VirB10